MSNEELYKENIDCFRCICNCEFMDKRMTNECHKQIKEAFETDAIYTTIGGIEMAIDWGVEVSVQEQYILNGYYDSISQNISQN